MRAGNEELWRCPSRYSRGCAQAEHEDLLPGLAADHGEGALSQFVHAVGTDLLIVDLGRAVTVGAGDAQAEIAIILAGTWAEADHVLVRTAVDRGKESTGEQVALADSQRLHLAVGGVPEGGDPRAGSGVGLRDVRHLGAVPGGELPAAVGVRAVAA